MKRALIVYDTKRGSTTKIAEWMKEALREKGWGVEILRTNGTESIDREFDLYIIGSPIYYERPLKTVMSFIKENAEHLKGKKVAIFAVNVANAFGHFTESYVRKRYIGSMAKLLKDAPFSTVSIRGWFRKQRDETQDEVRNWIFSLLESFSD